MYFLWTWALFVFRYPLLIAAGRVTYHCYSICSKKWITCQEYSFWVCCSYKTQNMVKYVYFKKLVVVVISGVCDELFFWYWLSWPTTGRPERVSQEFKCYSNILCGRSIENFRFYLFCTDVVTKSWNTIHPETELQGLIHFDRTHYNSKL